MIAVFALNFACKIFFVSYCTLSYFFLSARFLYINLFVFFSIYFFSVLSITSVLWTVVLVNNKYIFAYVYIFQIYWRVWSGSCAGGRADPSHQLQAIIEFQRRKCYLSYNDNVENLCWAVYLKVRVKCFDLVIQYC